MNGNIAKPRPGHRGRPKSFWNILISLALLLTGVESCWIGPINQFVAGRFPDEWYVHVVQWAKSPHDCRKNSSLSSCNFSKAPQTSKPVVVPPASLPAPRADPSKDDPAGNATKVLLGQASMIPAEGVTPKEPLSEFESQVIMPGTDFLWEFSVCFLSMESHLLNDRAQSFLRYKLLL